MKPTESTSVNVIVEGFDLWEETPFQMQKIVFHVVLVLVDWLVEDMFRIISELPFREHTVSIKFISLFFKETILSVRLCVQKAIETDITLINSNFRQLSAFPLECCSLPSKYLQINQVSNTDLNTRKCQRSLGNAQVT